MGQDRRSSTPARIMTAVLLDEEIARFMRSGISISVASRDVRHVPSLARAAGCRVAADLRTISVLLLPSQAHQLLADIAATGVIAVVFSSPSTNRTLQLKGQQASVNAASPEDSLIAAQQREGFAAGLIPLGYAHDLAHAVHCRNVQGMQVVTFSPSDIFEQTPGPRAGTRLTP